MGRPIFLFSSVCLAKNLTARSKEMVISNDIKIYPIMVPSLKTRYTPSKAPRIAKILLTEITIFLSTNYIVYNLFKVVLIDIQPFDTRNFFKISLLSSNVGVEIIFYFLFGFFLINFFFNKGNS